MVDTPSLALERVRLEFGHIGGIAHTMLDKLKPAMLSLERAALGEIAKMDDQVDILYAHIVRYLGEIRRNELIDEQSRDFLPLMSATTHLEKFGDIVETDLVGLCYEALEQDIRASETMRQLFTELLRAVSQALEAAVRGVRNHDETAAQDAIAMKDDIHRLVDQALAHRAAMLAAEDPNRLAVFRLEMEAVDKLKRIYALAKRTAKGTLPAALLDKAA